MFSFILKFFILVPILLLGYQLTNWLEKKGIKISRWFWGLFAFLIILVPLRFIPDLPMALQYILYGLCGIFAVVFFEQSRRMIEKRGSF